MLRSGAPEKSFMSECVSDVDLNNVLTAVWWNVSRETYLINMLHYHQDSVDFHPPLWQLVYKHFQHERTISVLH